MFIAIAIAQLFLMIFGIIEPNSLVGVFLGVGTWKSFLSLDGLFNVTNLLLSVTAVVGIVLKNSYVLFAAITIFILDSVFGLSGIVGAFPSPIGHILFGIISLVFSWLAIEWWRMNEQ